VICATYSQWRRFAALVGAPIARDGLPAWPGPLLADGSIDNVGTSSGSKLRVNGFSSTFRVATMGGHQFAPGGPIGPLIAPTTLGNGDTCWPLSITCTPSPTDHDAVAGVHEYDWYVYLRRDVGRYPIAGSPTLTEYAAPPFLVTMPDASASGRIQLMPNTSAVAALLPGLSGAALLTPAAWAVLFNHVHIYVQRRADKAIQWAKLYQR
jgi:hypothetical protein